MSDITIISHKRTSNFTIVPNHIINANYLKLEERAFLIWALSKPETWQLNYKSISTIHHISSNKIASISKALQANNHLVIHKQKCGKTNWLVFEEQSDCLEHKNTPVAPVVDPQSHFESEENTLKQEKNDEHASSPLELPHSQKPNLPNESALVRTDLLSRTEDLRSCSQNRERVKPITDFDIFFADMKKAWPNNNNMKRAVNPFKALIKNKATSESFGIVNMLKNDIQARLDAKQYGFEKMQLSTYLNGERWKDDIPVLEVDKNLQRENAKARAKEASDRKARELFGKK